MNLPKHLSSVLSIRLLVGCGLLVIALACSTASKAQNGKAANLSGIWRSEKGGVARIRQEGSTVQSTIVKIEKENEIYDFKPGDLHFTGVLEGSTIHGKMPQHYPRAYKTRCPAQWEYWVPFEGTVSTDGNLITIRRPRWYIGAGCSQMPGELSTDDFLRDRTLYTEKPAKIQMRLDPPSALVGQRIGVEVYLTGRNKRETIADREYAVSLNASQGRISPSELIIKPNTTGAEAELTSSQAGKVTVRASNKQGLQQAEKSGAICSSGDVKDLVFVTQQEQGPADGLTAIPFSLVFVDAQGTPTSGGHLKAIGFEHRGVGRRRSRAESVPSMLGEGTIPADQCVVPEELISERAGTATVIAHLGDLSPERTFSFYLPISLKLFSYVILGGLLGAFARSLRSKRPGRLPNYGVGVVAALVFFLAYYYGVLEYFPRLSGGIEIGLLLGIVGGYLGPVALDRITNIFMPPCRRLTQNRPSAEAQKPT